MTDHTHSQYIEGCYRCDLSRAVLERIAAMERDGHNLRLHDHTRATGTALIDAAYSLRIALSADRIELGGQP